MKVAIAGAGNVGTYIAADLKEAGHEVMVIEQDPDLVARLRVGLDVRWVVADACEVSSLHEAGLAEVDVVVAATGDDEDNLVISLLAKQEFAVPRVVARVNHPANQWLFNETWGVDVSVSTPHLLTALVEEAVSVGSLVRLLQFQDAHLVEVTLADSSPAVAVRIAELGVPRDATIVAVIRDRHVIVPRGETVMQAGDEVLVLVTQDTEMAVKALLVGTPTAPVVPPSAAAPVTAAGVETAGRSPTRKSEQLVAGVEHDQPAVAVLVRTPSAQHQSPAGADSGQVPPPGPHRHDRPAAVADGGFQRRRPGSGHDAYRRDLAGDGDLLTGGR